jgi:catechol 2,3-dioxygenase-like lactoylglutathione lyase family enzyme
MSDRGGDVSVPVTGVSELVLEVEDLGAAEAFYSGVLGLPVVERWPDREAIWVMAGDRTRIGLWRPQVGLAGGRGGAHVHFAMHITEEDYESAVALLRDRGQDVEEIAFDGAGRAAYVTDPDDNVVELWTWDVGEHLR